MNKTELITQVAVKTGLKKSHASLAVDTLLESIQQALQNGDNVQLIGFGTFDVRARATREGRNPSTGESLIIPAKKHLPLKLAKY